MPHIDHGPGDALSARAYANRLVTRQLMWWKRVVPVQMPYRWNVRRLASGLVLEVGCGIGRNLDHLRGRSVGVDTNLHAIQVARRRGLAAYEASEFGRSPEAMEGRFDTLLCAHVVEHLGRDSAHRVLSGYLRFLKRPAALVLIAPQEAGFRSDGTHVEFFDFDRLRDLAHSLGFEVTRCFSFPFPRPFGRVFTYNEFVLVGRRASEGVGIAT